MTNLADDVFDALPEFKCHKTVRAARIETVDILSDSDVEIAITLEGHYQLTHVRLEAAIVQRYFPRVGDYLVVYGDNVYMSISPSKVFEEGYHKKHAGPITHFSGGRGCGKTTAALLAIVGYVKLNPDHRIAMISDFNSSTLTYILKQADIINFVKLLTSHMLQTTYRYNLVVIDGVRDRDYVINHVKNHILLPNGRIILINNEG